MFLTLNEKFWVSLIIQDISQILFGSIASYTQCFCLSAIYRYRNLYRPIPITIPIPIYRPIPIPKLYRSHTVIKCCIYNLGIFHIVSVFLQYRLLDALIVDMIICFCLPHSKYIHIVDTIEHIGWIVKDHYKILLLSIIY